MIFLLIMKKESIMKIKRSLLHDHIKMNCGGRNLHKAKEVRS